MALPEKETLTVEFKSDRARLSDDDLVEAVVALANTQGGELYLGVEDDGTPTGLNAAHQDAIRLAAMVGNRTRPSLSVRTELILVDKVVVARVQVDRFTGSLVATQTGKVLRRRLTLDGSPEIVPIYPYEMPRVLANMGSFDVSEQPVNHATPADLDPLERERLRQIIVKYNGDKTLLQLSDDELDGALGITIDLGGVAIPTVTGLLMIGREASLRRMIPAHEALFQVLSGTAVHMNDSFRSPLLKLFDTFLERFRARNDEQEFDEGMFRVPVPDYDERGLVEAHGASGGQRRSFTLSAMVYRATGKSAEYVRQVGFDAIQQEQMVLKYVEAHGKITRRDAMELSRISSFQASHLLQKLASEGKLVLKGIHRGAFYERSS